MNVLELKKGDEVYILKHRLDGFTEGLYVTKAEVLGMRLRNGNVNVRLLIEDKHSGYISECLFNESAENIFTTRDDAYFGRNVADASPADVSNWLSAKLGCVVSPTGIIYAYKWNDELKKAESYNILYRDGHIDILSYELPDGVYPTKEACEAANKKTVKVAVHKTVTRIVDVEANTHEEALDWIDEHIEECDPLMRNDEVGDYYTEILQN